MNVYKNIPESKKISQSCFFDVVLRTVSHESGDESAFTLVLGSGVSYGIIPTAREMLGGSINGEIHKMAIPLYLKKDVPISNAEEEVRNFWKEMAEKNNSIDLDETGFPKNIENAYEIIFSPHCEGGFSSRKEATAYLRDTIHEGTKKGTNGFHFYLSSVLAMSNSPENHYYIGKKRFAQTIFTTNFDSLLQVALQNFGQLYYITDLPAQLSEDTFTDLDETVLHLFYAHGSSYRNYQANSKQEVYELIKNSKIIADQLKKRAIILLGYSGWDDCITSALNSVESLPCDLYWLARSEESLTPTAKKIISEKCGAYFVKIKDADDWAARLHYLLCPHLPFTKLLQDPISVMIEKLSTLKLSTISHLAEMEKWDEDFEESTKRPIEILYTPDIFKTFIIDSLIDFKDTFDELNDVNIRIYSIFKELNNRNFSQVIESSIEIEPNLCGISKIYCLECRAIAYFHQEKYELAISVFNDILTIIDTDKISYDRTVTVMMAMALCCQITSNNEKALGIYQSIIDSPESTMDEKMGSFIQKGIAHSEMGDYESAIRDMNELLEIPGISNDRASHALNNRGHYYLALKNIEKALNDFDEVIKMEDIENNVKSRSLISRAGINLNSGKYKDSYHDLEVAKNLDNLDSDIKEKLVLFSIHVSQYVKNGESDRLKVVKDFLELEEESETFTVNSGNYVFDQSSFAFSETDYVEKMIQKAHFYERQKSFDKAFHLYDEIIDNENIGDHQKYKSILHRGLLYANLHEDEKAIKDFSVIISKKFGSKYDIVNALYNRAVLYEKKLDFKKAELDYKTIINDPNMEEKLKITSYVNMGVLYEKTNKLKEALDVYSKALGSSRNEIPEQFLGLCLSNRAGVYFSLNEFSKSIEDYTNGLKLNNIEFELKNRMRLNRGLVYNELAKYNEAYDDFTFLIKSEDTDDSQKGQALFHRGVILLKKGRIFEAREDFDAIEPLKGISSELKKSASVYAERLSQEIMGMLMQHEKSLIEGNQS